MKKLFFLITTSIFFLPAMAQFHLGLRTGLHFNQINALGWQDNYQTSPFAGVYANFGAKRWSLQMEFIYTNQKITTDTSFKGLYQQYYNGLLDSNKNGAFTFTKIQVPILVTLKFNKKLWLQGGLQYNNTIDVVDKNNFVQSGKNIFKSNDIAAVGGLWFNVTKRLNLNVRYVQGMVNLNNLSSLSSSPALNPKTWKNQTIQLGIGYRLL
jgi:hypothetical protein